MRLVENGDLYERKRGHFGRLSTLVVPHDAGIELASIDGAVEIYLRKSLRYYGNTLAPMSYESMATLMGLGAHLQDDSVTLGTFGEWWTESGSATIKVIFVVPQTLDVRRQEGLSGPESRVSAPEIYGQSSSQESSWPGAFGPAEGWKALTFSPDPDHRAQNLRTPLERARDALAREPEDRLDRASFLAYAIGFFDGPVNDRTLDERPRKISRDDCFRELLSFKALTSEETVRSFILRGRQLAFGSQEFVRWKQDLNRLIPPLPDDSPYST